MHIGHIELFVTDPAQARQFYEEVLGFEVWCCIPTMSRKPPAAWRSAVSNFRAAMATMAA